MWPDIRDRYVAGFLERNPIDCTYLGGEGYSARLAALHARLPDVSAPARADRVAFYRSILGEIDRIDAGSLTPDDAIDRDLARAQILHLLHLDEDLRHYQRSVETDTVAPFRGVDWQIQQMSDRGGGLRGTLPEWERVAGRVEAIPTYLRLVQANLEEGIAARNLPDNRMVRHDGIEASDGHATWFRDTLPDLARRLIAAGSESRSVVAALRRAGGRAAAAFETFGRFLEETYRPFAGVDRFAAGEREYDWRLHNNLRLDAGESAASLFEYGDREVRRSQALLFETAREVAVRRGLRLEFEGRAAALVSTRRVMDDLSRDHPHDDEEMFRLYRAKADDLVEYARRHAMFDLPRDYALEIVPTPAVLESTLEAAYYPAPAFRASGAGRFYLTASRGDLGVLKENNVHAMADLCAHEGFPGHDWHYRFMRSRAASISPIRWLDPGGVEDGASMWQGSLASEGWALYAEQLMGEPQPGAPRGFYTPEERLYQLKWQVLRDARVHIDAGLHGGRLTFDGAVAYFLQNVELLPGACDHPGSDPVSDAACSSARRAVYRYSKWPTQAITYHLGKREILALRDRQRAMDGGQFSLRAFHERFLGSGAIPPGCIGARLLREPAGGTP